MDLVAQIKPSQNSNHSLFTNKSDNHSIKTPANEKSPITNITRNMIEGKNIHRKCINPFTKREKITQ